MKFSLRSPIVSDPQQQQNNEGLLEGVNAVARFIYAGTGVPSFTPTGPALYFRYNFGVNASVYVWDGSWKSVT